MSVGETYVALANGLLHPTSLSPITIFEHDEYLYCIDTRRLTIAKELQRRNKSEVLKHFPVQYVKEGDAKFAQQWYNLAHERLTAMKKKNLDGSTIKLDRKSGRVCCFKVHADSFRDDLEEQVFRDHLKMNSLEFEQINVSQCSACNGKSHIYVCKPSNKSKYRVMQKCACQKSEPKMLKEMENPWTQVTLQEICYEIRRWNRPLILASLECSFKSFKPTESLFDVKAPAIREFYYNNSAKCNNYKVKEIRNDGSINHFCMILSRI